MSTTKTRAKPKKTCIANTNMTGRLRVDAVSISGAIVVLLAIVSDCTHFPVAVVSLRTSAAVASNGVYACSESGTSAVSSGTLVHIGARLHRVSCESSGASACERADGVGAESVVGAVVEIDSTLVDIRASLAVTSPACVATAGEGTSNVRTSSIRTTTGVGSHHSAFINIDALAAAAGIASVAGASEGSGSIAADSLATARMCRSRTLIHIVASHSVAVVTTVW